MKHNLLVFLFLMGVSFLHAQETVVKIDTYYTGEALTFGNPPRSDGQGGCITKVTVNGLPMESRAGSPRGYDFQLRPDTARFHKGDTLHIRITYAAGCKPPLPEEYNFSAFYYFEHTKPTFRMAAHWFSTDSTTQTTTLHWQTTNEKDKLNYSVEQFRWNNWVKIGEVEGQGIPSVCDYQFVVPDLVSGYNQFRVVQTGSDHSQNASSILYCVQQGTKVSFWPASTSDVVHFTRPTTYYVYDQNGKPVLNGLSNAINVTLLPKGTYSLYFDNQTGNFVRQ